jgi:hypothetical protein
MKQNRSSKNFVIPAKAGIHHRHSKFHLQVMDPRLRGGDENVVY